MPRFWATPFSVWLARKASSQSWAASASFSWLKLGSPGYFSTNFLMSASLGSRLMVAL